MANRRHGLSSAVPAAPARSPLSPALQASCRNAANRRLGPGPDSCTAATVQLFDHLVGADEERWWIGAFAVSKPSPDKLRKILDTTLAYFIAGATG
jgi:hypothetical protein